MGLNLDLEKNCRKAGPPAYNCAVATLVYNRAFFDLFRCLLNTGSLAAMKIIDVLTRRVVQVESAYKLRNRRSRLCFSTRTISKRQADFFSHISI